MKRAQDFSQTPSAQTATPVAKKLKLTPPDSPAEASGSNGVENEWTTVTKRKAKKVKKIEGKLDVGVMAHAHGTPPLGS